MRTTPDVLLVTYPEHRREHEDMYIRTRLNRFRLAIITAPEPEPHHYWTRKYFLDLVNRMDEKVFSSATMQFMNGNWEEWINRNGYA